jgi:LuxR family maltose regulon positive regulatory protein
MQTTLLTTKLFVPPIREELVARSRLTAILSDAFGKGLTLISAPAGYGKTTLVSSWLREAGIPSAWLSLEDSDNDPVRFLQYLLTALHEVIPSVRSDLLDMVDGVQLASFQAVMGILINEITKQTSRFVLVMDDFHLIQDQIILDLVSFLLDHLPSQQMHLILITRTDPPLSLSRIRVRNQMVEIRAEQLRFTQGEVAEFINGLMRFSLSDEEISAMCTRTEGWIAGLQLASLSMKECSDIPGFVDAFSGSHHYIVDYLAEEVLKCQDEQTRAFLIQTSILSRMCASLCESLINGKPGEQLIDGQNMLEALHKKNLFIVPLDEERRWYRYHHLFADALYRRLEHQYPDLLPIIYRRASGWYEANGLIGEAIQYALNAGDQERAAQMVEQNGCYLLMSGELITLLKWMDAVEPYFQAYPWLVIQKGWALTLAKRMEPAEQSFKMAERLVSALIPSPDVSSMIGTISAGRAYWADIQGNVPEASKLAQQALDLLPDTDPLSQSMRSVAMGSLANTLVASGELDRARQILDQALEIGKAANNVEMIINTNGDICDILLEQGKLKQAEGLLLEILPMTVRADGQRLPLSARVYSGLSKVYYEWNQLEQAAHYARLCLEVSKRWGDEDQQAVSSVLLAKLERVSGDVEKASTLMNTADQLQRDHRLYPGISIRIEAALDRFQLSVGNMEGVSHQITTSGMHSTDEISFQNELRYITLLRWLLVSENYDAALKLVQRMLQKAKDGKRITKVIELLILQSLAYLGKKNTIEAGNSLILALSLAQPEGHRRVFLDEGEGIRKLLFSVKSNPQISRYANELLEAFTSASGSTPAPIQLLIEPMSAREIEVLKLIEAGLSNQEIGYKLFISMGTVKRHISNIYSKLDVKSRSQAIARGKELGLFEL